MGKMHVADEDQQMLAEWDGPHNIPLMVQRRIAVILSSKIDR